MSATSSASSTVSTQPVLQGRGLGKRYGRVTALEAYQQANNKQLFEEFLDGEHSEQPVA